MKRKIRSWLSDIREHYHAFLSFFIKINRQRLSQHSAAEVLVKESKVLHQPHLFHIVESAARPADNSLLWLDIFKTQTSTPSCAAVTFKDAEIIGNGIVVDKDGTLQLESTVFQQEYLDRLKQTHLVVTRHLIKPLVIDKEVIVVADYLSSNYFHWVMEGLARLAAYHQAGHFFKEKIIAVSPVSPPFVKQSLQLFFGIDEQQILYLNTKRVKARSVTLISYLHQRNAATAHLDVYHSAVFKLLSSSLNATAHLSKRIIIARKNVSERQWQNLPEIEKQLMPFGFKVVFTEELSFAEQVQIFAGVEMVIAIHGAAFANLMFAVNCLVLVEIFPASRRLTDVCDMYQLTQNKGIHHYWLVAEDDGLQTQHVLFTAAMIAEVKAIVAAL